MIHLNQPGLAGVGVNCFLFLRYGNCSFGNALQVKKWGFAGLLNARAQETVPDTPEAPSSDRPLCKESVLREEHNSQEGAPPSQTTGTNGVEPQGDRCRPQQTMVAGKCLGTLKDKLLASLNKQNGSEGVEGIYVCPSHHV